MTKGTQLPVWGAVAGALVLFVTAWATWEASSAPHKAPAPARPALSPIARESMSLLAPTLKNVYFGMTQPQLQAARRRAVRQSQADEPQFFMFDEKLSATERILYGIDNTDLTLAKVQIAGALSSVEDVAPRIALMQSRYGAPTGVWDCPALPGQLPTRRFMFQRSALGVMDSFLMLGDKIAVTLYIAPLSLLRQSLAVARCTPTAKDALTRFPAVPLPAHSQSN